MRRTSIFVALFIALGMAHAQQIPDAGRILREQQQPVLAPSKPTTPGPRIEMPERPALTAPIATRFQIKAFRVTGTTAFPATRLEELVREFVGREIGIAELQEAAAIITRFYRKNGYPVARAYLPAQDIHDGVVEIAVLEGRYGRVVLNNSSRVKDEVVRRNLAPLQPGTTINSKLLESSLLLLSDLSGVGTPDTVLRPGVNTGESDLAVSVEAAPLASGSIDLDNYGNRFTGDWRTSGSFALASPTGHGDLFTAHLTTAGRGLTSALLGYQLPVGGDGLRFGAAYSDTQYYIGKDFSALDASGDARVATLSASYPFVRSLGFNLTGQLSFDAKRLEDRVGATSTVSSKHNDIITAGLSGNWLNSAGNASNNFSLAAASGQLRLDSAAAQLSDDSGARTHGSFSKLSYAISQLQQFGGPFSGFVSLLGQEADKNLDSSEKFLLGGPYGVRAYPQGEAAGDDGFLFTAELRYRAPQVPVGSIELVALIDHGESRINHSTFAPGANTRRLSGAGIGINVTSSSGWLLRSVWSWRTGNESATSDTPRSGRGWLQLAKFF